MGLGRDRILSGVRFVRNVTSPQNNGVDPINSTLSRCGTTLAKGLGYRRGDGGYFLRGGGLDKEDEKDKLY